MKVLVVHHTGGEFNKSHVSGGGVRWCVCGTFFHWGVH